MNSGQRAMKIAAAVVSTCARQQRRIRGFARLGPVTGEGQDDDNARLVNAQWNGDCLVDSAG
jgi:hypothetical protein